MWHVNKEQCSKPVYLRLQISIATQEFMRKLLFLIAGLISFQYCIGQQVRPATAAQIYNEIARLKNLTNVLYLAAHPDDENTRLLAWLVNDQHIRTGYLSLTRGDGGQNILGSEQGAALGLIRTHELMEARKIDGAEQYFTSAIDFGFSKTPDETFKHWNQYSLTYDIVWVIRQFRPDVIITRFPPDSRAGHGQHSASAILAEKAFKLAGDKLQYTEQLKYYAEWQPKRLVWNTFKFGSSNTTSEAQFKMPVGNYSPLIGMGYGELAGISRSIHRSQGAGTPSVAGIQKEYFQHVAGDSIRQSLFDGIDITWNRVGRPEIAKDIEVVLQQYSFTHPEASLPALLELRNKIVGVSDKYWRAQKLSELDEILLHASGLMAEATTKRPQAVAGVKLPVTLRIISRSGLPVHLASVQSTHEVWPADLDLVNDSLYTQDFDFTVPANQQPTEPYWLHTIDASAGQFMIPFDTLRGLPETPNSLSLPVHLVIGGQKYTIRVPISYKKLDPLRGDVVEQLRVVPDVSIEPYANLLVTQPDGRLNTSVRIHAYKDIAGATLSLYGTKEPIRINSINLKANADTSIPISIPAAASKKDDYYLEMELSEGAKRYNQSLRLIQYEHLPTLQYFTPPTAKVLRNDWKVAVKKIGFIEGAGENTVSLLRQAGLTVDVLKDADLANAARLKGYEAIITGIRAVNTEKKMSYWLPVLMQYVQNGGTLIMEYNTLQDLSTTNIGPYPFNLTSKRVTEENAAVTFLQPQHKVLNYPNKITQADFDGWVQERGLYFADKWDERYLPLFKMSDTGEEPLSGGTLYTSYGKGHYIYTSLAFFRQLPAGNKGAIKLLMNMLSVGKTAK
jgi:LmbE family N-acetylglucosaminyl deacetylase